MHTSIFVYAVAIAAVGAFLAGLYYMFSGLRGDDGKIVDRRLGELARPVSNQAKLRRRSLSSGKSPWLAAVLETASLRSFDRLVATSGIRMSTERILFLVTIGTAVIFEVLNVIGGYNLVICAAAALLLGIVAPVMWILHARR